jgi:hypothetical protein
MTLRPAPPSSVRLLVLAEAVAATARLALRAGA